MLLLNNWAFFDAFMMIKKDRRSNWDVMNLLMDKLLLPESEFHTWPIKEICLEMQTRIGS